jgi:hypothetical protein
MSSEPQSPDDAFISPRCDCVIRSVYVLRPPWLCQQCFNPLPEGLHSPLLPLDVREVAKIGGPVKRRAMPDLPSGSKFTALFQGSDADSVKPWFVRIGGVYRCATVGAKAVSTPITALGDFDVNPGSAGKQNELSGRHLYSDSIGGAAERLTIGTVANPNRVRVDLGFEGDLAAMAMAFNFHGRPHKAFA